MNRWKRWVAIVLMLMMAIGSVPTVTAEVDTIQVTVSGMTYYDEAFEVLAIVNEERAAQGLPPLAMDKSLLESAMLRAGEIGLYYSHTRPDGTVCFTVNDKAWGENIAIGYTSAADVMDGWMNSEGHRNNILNNRWSSIGIGCMEINNMLCWVQLFGEVKAETVAQPANQEKILSVSAIPDLLDLRWDGLEDGLQMKVGETTDLPLYWLNVGWEYQATVASPADFTYTCSNTYVARPDGKGNLTAVGGGTATLTIAHKDDPSVSVSIAVTVSGSAAKPNLGDVDQNGKVEANDALLTLQAATGKITLNASQQKSANVDSDNKITANDALMILQSATGKIAL